jgi:hypothetical protein
MTLTALKPLPVVDLDELSKVREVSEQLLVDAEAFVVTDDQTYNAAIEIHDAVKLRVKTIEDHRKSITAPINEALHRINDEHNQAKGPLERIVKLLNDRAGKFLDDREAKKAAEERRQAEENRKAQMLVLHQAQQAEAAAKRGEEVAPVEAVPAPEPVAAIVVPDKTSHSDVATGTWREVVAFEVSEERLIPRSYLIPDTVKIGKAIRSGTTIPGVKRIVNRVRATRGV